ncbi:neuromedin-K receptor-like [Dendronephthya gigantea]|uniref:neuromedin-K receptor-like n=1 Tax=Dendronephthya gigantea TaxID=151771 RepID=UPI00106B82CF|nr:neuromedin-K receptor-like [Dendronephthya gigantea]XP_028408313.1 neuromedin-K receptor-like [Dendronephthya gigantea]XP_028408314.1 neuromedin-K receptor-like [Dendronephthya gigantea]XP_028408315.1 neuromedin-K receptor-like [Dendronephthya gigantea]XP_028408316.1 neuromedin-K receptor-like [Dendronephthya gigantea]XP_028408317.1 neuromedin-K receptor-like [Dendronephthya gigantea]XP_028408318.1 neuromedin-K receptor-like [Dendronephthya gigantea]XP_028408319.1 neuromedin-K receptor-li
MSAVNITNSTCPPASEDSDAEKAVKTLAYALVILMAFLGNVLVIGVIYKNKKMRTITNFQIVNMSLADILITVAAMPATVFQIYQGSRWPFGLIPCKLVVFLQGISVSCSVFTMACIAIDRFCAILYPYKKYIDQRRCNIMIGLCWLLAVLLQSPTLYAMKIAVVANQTTCIEGWEPLFDNESSPKVYTVILFVSMYMLPLLVIAILYAAISHFLWRHKTPGSSLVKARKDRSKAAKVIKMLIIIVVVFAVCWLPSFVAQFLQFFARPRCGVPPSLFFMGFFLSHANSAFNPAIYWIFNDNFRAGFKQLLRTWFCPWWPAPRFNDSSAESQGLQSTVQKA